MIGQRTLPFLLAVLVAFLVSCGAKPSGYDASPIPVDQDPLQGASLEPMPMRLSAGGYQITLTPLAAYELRGVVLGRETYRMDWSAALCPCDVAMAWGPLASSGLYRRLSWSQDNRWYFWEYSSDFPMSDDWVARYSSNTHVIPATPNLARALRNLKVGKAAEIAGTLVQVDGVKGDQTVGLISSTSRVDRGAGSCEILYLTRLRVDRRIYR